MDAERWASDYGRFCEATDRFYSGQMTVKEYKGISGGMGSYAQRGAAKGMVRLRMAGGRLTRERLDLVCDCIERYSPETVHFTTCQSVQLHGLDGDSVKGAIRDAQEAGVSTFGSGGDCPRNVTATPLSGIIPTCMMDVMPYAQAADRYLTDMACRMRLPRKLKVGFTSTLENITDATARDLGFVATSEGRFDVYAGGGLGRNPELGLLVERSVDPSEFLAYADAMFRMFSDLGNYENRSRARVRYLRDDIGDGRFLEELKERVAENLRDDTFPKVHLTGSVVMKSGDGSVPSNGRAKRQKREGLFYVPYHPIGGDPSPGKLAEIRDCITDMEDAEVRISPNQTLYVVNLTGKESDRVAEVLSDGAPTIFSSSVCCVGSTVCQVGLRDSAGLLGRLIDMERRNGFADRVLPMMRISGCGNSCAAHQLGTVALSGSRTIDGEPSFRLHVNGSHLLGRERFGDELGDIKESELPAFFEAVGKAVTESGTGSFREWYNADPSRLDDVGRGFIHPIARRRACREAWRRPSSR
jgi:ferredoxin-nitrite reductase